MHEASAAEPVADHKRPAAEKGIAVAQALVEGFVAGELTALPFERVRRLLGWKTMTSTSTYCS